MSETSSTLVSRTLTLPRQSTHYIECGPVGGPLMIFLHGWPSLGLMWRAQMDAFAADGWHCVAPDLRGFGGSSAPLAIEAYAIEEVVADMTELHDHLGAQPAIWVSHDWGVVVAAGLAAHHPARSRGVVLTSLAYQPAGHALRTLVPLVDRTIYPIEQYPDGQWDYYRYYTTHFETAVADLDADAAASLATIFRRGDPAGLGKVAPHAMVTRNGGRFGAAHRAPPTEPDPSIWPPADFDALVQAYKGHGFRPSCAWYLNDDPTWRTLEGPPIVAACRNRFSSSTAPSIRSAPSAEIARAIRCEQRARILLKQVCPPDIGCRWSERLN